MDFDDVLARHAQKHRRDAASSAPTSPARCWTSAPAGSSASRARRSTSRAATGDEQPYTRPSRRRRRRQLRPAAPVDGPAPSARTARWAWPSAPTSASPRHDDDWLESWLELWDGEPRASNLLPGYGWIFGVGDGTSNVGLGILNSSEAFGKSTTRALLHRWVATMPPDWEYTAETRSATIRGAALPMGFNRTPHYTSGLLLVGDAGGMVNPFNGEGIAYAMESGRLAAEVVAQALARPDAPGRERALQSYPQVMEDALGGYYTLGRRLRRS